MDMDWMRLPLGEWAEVAVDWVTTYLDGLFSVLRSIFNGMNDGLSWLLMTPPFWAVIVVIAVIAFFAKGWKLALGTIIGLLVIVSVDQWENAMSSLSLVLVATIIALVVALPLGILAAKSDLASSIIRPCWTSCRPCRHSST